MIEPRLRFLIGISVRPSWILVAAALAISTLGQAKTQRSTTLLNVSYDPTRELYEEYNAAFSRYWKTKTGQSVEIQQSHGASGKQSRSVADGLEADVVTLGLAYDVDALVDAGLVYRKWQGRLPNNSCPYTSTIVFLVRKGNPKHIRDWDDLIKPGIQVIVPNPKASGGARWSYLAAWGYAFKHWGNNKAARDFVTKLFRNVPVFDTGARGATLTFVKRGIGDVLLSWENEAYLAQQKLGSGKYEIVSPSTSILAEPPVTVVDRVVLKKGTARVATEYLRYLYSNEGQKIIAHNYYRPRNIAAAGAYAARFKKIPLFTIELFGGWAKAQHDHFDDGGIFDQILRSIR